MNLVPLKPKLLSVQLIHDAYPTLLKQLGIQDQKNSTLGLVTCDMDDALYTALDEATKQAPVEVSFAKSFFAGSKHASGPYSGEAIGVLAGQDTSHVKAGLLALENYLKTKAWFYTFESTQPQSAFFPHVIPRVGSYLSKLAEVPEGSALAYLIACPLEAIIGLDAALKHARVDLVKYFPPPTETNFAGGLLTGNQTECEHAARAFTEAIYKVSLHPFDVLT